MGRPTGLRIDPRAAVVAFMAATLIASLLNTSPATAQAGASGAGASQALPECAGGPLEDTSAPPAPLTSGHAACRAQPVRTAEPSGHGNNGQPVPHPRGTNGAHDYFGGESNPSFTSRGIYAALNVVDPSVPHPRDGYLLSQRILSKTCGDSFINWLEIGWTEVGWRDDRQYIYTYSSQDYMWHFYEQYPLTPGMRIYVELYQLADGWDAYLWWNGSWQFLRKIAGANSFTCAEALVEEGFGGGTYVPFGSPNIQFGDGTTGGLQIAHDDGVFRTWGSNVPTYEWNLDEPVMSEPGLFGTQWNARYYDFLVFYANRPPVARVSISPSFGTTSTLFTASLAQSSDPDNDSLTYEIDWGDGYLETSTSPTFTHQYSSALNYTVTVTVTDTRGAASSTATIVRVCLTGTGACAQPTTADATADEELADYGTDYSFSLTGPCFGQWTEASSGNCLHGDSLPDMEPDPYEPLSSDYLVATTGTNPAYCDGTDASQPRVQVVYATTQARGDRFNNLERGLRRKMEHVDNWTFRSARQSGGTRHVRYVCQSNGRISILKKVLPNDADNSYSKTQSELKTAGLNASDRKYVVFVDWALRKRDGTRSKGVCGQAPVAPDASSGQGNFNNLGDDRAIVYLRADYCVNRYARSAMHELGHILGAVICVNGGPCAPNNNEQNSGHPEDRHDALADASDPNTRIVCSDAINKYRYDCNKNDYFNANVPPPPQGQNDPDPYQWLRNHWNAANNQFLVGGGSS